MDNKYYIILCGICAIVENFQIMNCKDILILSVLLV